MAETSGMRPKRYTGSMYALTIYVLWVTTGLAAGARNQGVFLPTATAPGTAAAAAPPAAIPVTTTSSGVIFVTLPPSPSSKVQDKRRYDLPPVPGPGVTPVADGSPEVPQPSGATVTTVTTTTTTTTTVTTVPPPAAATAAATGGKGCGGMMGPCDMGQQQQHGSLQQQQQHRSGDSNNQNDSYNSDMNDAHNIDSKGDGQGGRQGKKDKHHKHHKKDKKSKPGQNVDQQSEDTYGYDGEYPYYTKDGSSVITQDDGEEYDGSVPPWATSKPSPGPSTLNLTTNPKPTLNPATNSSVANDVNNNKSDINNVTSNTVTNDRGGRDGEEFDNAIPPGLQSKPSPSPKPAAAAAPAPAAPKASPNPSTAAAAASKASPNSSASRATSAAAAQVSPSPSLSAATAATAQGSPSHSPVGGAASTSTSPGPAAVNKSLTSRNPAAAAISPVPVTAAATAAAVAQPSPSPSPAAASTSTSPSPAPEVKPSTRPTSAAVTRSPSPAAVTRASPSPSPAAAAAAGAASKVSPSPTPSAAAAAAAKASPSPSPAAAAAAAAASKASPSPGPAAAALGKEDSGAKSEEATVTEVVDKPSPTPASATAAGNNTASTSSNSTAPAASQPTKAAIVDGRAVVTATTAGSQPSPSPSPSPAAATASPFPAPAAAAAAGQNAAAKPITVLQPAFGSLTIPSNTNSASSNATSATAASNTPTITGYVAEAKTRVPPPKPFIVQQAGAKQKILIGCVLPFEGTQEIVGKAVYQALKMALTDKAKEILPGVDVNLTCSNTKCIDIPAFVATNEFVKEGAVAIVGDVCSGATVAAAGVSNAKQLPIISAASSSPSLSQPDFFFRTVPSDRYQGMAAADLIVRNGGRNVGVIYEDSPYGYGLAFSFIAAFTPHGGNVPVIYSFKRGQGNPEEAVAKMLAGKKNGTFPLDAVFIATNNITFTSEFLKQAFVDKLGLKIYSGDSSANPALYDNLKDTPAAVANFVITAPNPGNPAFAAAFKKFTGGNDSAYSVYASRGYDAMVALLQSYKAAAAPKKGQDIVTQLQRQNFSGVSGPIAFDKNGDLVVTDNTYVSATFDPSTLGIKFGQPISMSTAGKKTAGR